MLIPFQPVKTIAKILLMFMMPAGKIPVATTLPQQLEMITANLIAMGPTITKYHEGFLLQFCTSPTAYIISTEQMSMIMAGMDDEEKYAVFNPEVNPSITLAAYIIRKGYVPLESSASSSSSSGYEVSLPPSSSLSNIDQYHEQIRRTHAPTLYESVQDFCSKYNISFVFRIIPGSRRVNISNEVRPLHGELITMPPGTIQQYKQQGDIKMLQLIRDRLLTEYNKWIPSADYYDIRDQLEQAEQSLIDLGQFDYPQLCKVRDMAKNGQIEQLAARYKQVDTLMLSRKGHKKEGGTRILRLQQYCLMKAVNNELLKTFEALAVAEGPEVKVALLEVYRKYYSYDQNVRAYYEKPAGFGIIDNAHALVQRQHPNAQQVIAEAQQEFIRGRVVAPATTTQTAASSSSASSSSAPTTTAVTGPGTTTTTSTTQSHPNSDLPITGANTSSASSLTTDVTPISTDPEYDFTQTYGYDDTIQMSKKAEERIVQTLDAIKPQDFDNFDLYLAQVDTIIAEERLAPSQEYRIMVRFVKRFFSNLNPIIIAQELPDALLHTTLLVMEFLSINADSDEWYVPPINEEARRAQIQRFCNKFDLTQLTAEQRRDLVADVLAGHFVGLGITRIAKLMKAAKVIETVKRSTEPARVLAKKLGERLKTFTKPVGETIAITAEGIPVSIATGAQETVSLQQAANKASGAAKKAEAAVLRVGNMKEFFQTKFGQELKKICTHTSRQYKDATIYKVTGKIKHPMLEAGDLFYLDKVHLDHIEVFSHKGRAKGVLNLDGTVNAAKTEIALAQGRTIPT